MIILDLHKIVHLSKPEPSEIKSLFSTGSISLDTLTGEKEILAIWLGLGGVIGLCKPSIAWLRFYIMLHNARNYY